METRQERTGMFLEGSPGYDEDEGFHYLNAFAYPLNTLGKPEIVGSLLDHCKRRQVYGLGRWGEHSHYNSDVVVEKALDLADKFVLK